MSTRLFADISNNNSEPDFHLYKNTGHVAIAIKASEGVSFVDPFHRGWCLRAGGLHLPIFHYHFARPDFNDNPRAEALHFLASTHGLLGSRDYVVLDLERATPAGWSHDPAWSREFDVCIREKTRFRTILYANRSTLQQSDDWLQRDPKRVWDADWSTAPDFAPKGYKCVIRQFTDGIFGPEPHELPGIGRTDVNRLSWPMWQQIVADTRR